jgi:hypothetical protein
MVQFHSFFHFLEAEDFYRFVLCAEHDPSLEYGNWPALRALLAGPIGFATTFRNVEDKFPPSAADAPEFRALARPQPSFTAPLVRPLPKRAEAAAFHSAKEATHLLRCRRMSRSLSGQPKVLAAPARSRIRAEDLARHEDRNEKEFIPN